MAALELTHEELTTLKDVLENDVIELKREVIHTSHRDFKKILIHKEELLEKIVKLVEIADK